jgi:pyruvate dehydrogenase E2 component (dihydrolipoamide acetyltransferase)
MAERTAHSWSTVPHFFLTREVDATGLNETRGKAASATEKSDNVRVSHTDLLVALVAHSLAKHSLLNASWIDGAIRTNPEINIGLAIAVDDAVVAPVIPHADKISLSQIASLRQQLSERARTGKLRPADLAGGTFTISNLGMFHVDAFSAIIIPPQAAILAVGRIADRVVAWNGQPAIRPVLSLTLSADHRVVDGARAARFLDTLVEVIQNPDKYLTQP